MNRKLLVVLSVFTLIVSMTPTAIAAGGSTSRGAELTESGATAAETTVSKNQLLAKQLVSEADTAGLYLIRLQDAPVASYEGGVSGLAATSPTAVNRSLSDNITAVREYTAHLENQQTKLQSKMSRSFGHKIDVRNTYTAGNNGFSAWLTPQEASEVALMPGVTFVQRDLERVLHTDSGPGHIGAGGLWGADCVDNCGEGIVVGVIDTGINPLNPSFLDVGGDGYNHTNPKGKFFGVCDPTNLQDPGSDSSSYDGGVFPCNDKLIGAWGYDSVNGFDPTDYDGHGSHTASTAAGNYVFAAPVSGSGAAATFDISGVAPHANIIAYGACCTLSALTAAIDQAIIDEVDVINYSIGSSGASDLWNDFDTVGYLAARDAGIFVATSAGNDGPGAETLGSPADAPWLTSVAASTHTRSLQNSLINMSGGDTTPPADVFGKGFTGALAPAAPIVYAGDFGDALCGPGSFAPGTFSGEIVVCDRGTFGRVQKSQSVADGGAGGYVLVNGPADAATLNGDAFAVPGVHISNANGIVLKAWLASGAGHTAEIGGFSVAFPTDYPDSIASFSSRGANRAIDLVSPSVAAPGLDVIAAEGVGGEIAWGIISGTSMASPHVAGAGALMMKEHPDWSPAEIQSALMTTGFTAMVNEDGSTPSGPFDMGSGRVDLEAATAAGLVLDETTANYLGANPADGGDPRALNVASMANSQCLTTCTWTRTVKGTAGADWNATTSGLPLTVSPSSFSLTAGSTQELTITADVSALPSGDWLFGEVQLSSDGGLVQHMPVALIPSTGIFDTSAHIWTRRNAGSHTVAFQSGEVTDLTTETRGLVKATQQVFSLSEDPTNGDPYDNVGDGTVEFITVAVPSGASRFVVETFDSEAADIDIYIGTGTTPSEATNVCIGGSPGANEYCNIADPAAGDYWILVQNWEGSADQPDNVTLAYGAVTGDEGNMTVTGPAAVPELEPYDLTIGWDDASMEAGDRFYGSFSVGSDPGNPGSIGTVDVDLERHEDDVTKSVDNPFSAPGETLTFEIVVQPNVTHEDVTYTITDTLPDGLTLVPGSATGDPVVSGNTLTWTVDMPSPFLAEGSYVMSTPADNPNCDTGFGGYVDLETLIGAGTNPGISGDTAQFTAFTSGAPFSFYGEEHTGISFVDDGFAIFDLANNYGGSPWFAQALPDPDAPNNVAAMLWNDFELFYDAGTNQGVSLASTGDSAFDAAIVEYDNIELYGGSPAVLDMEIVMWRSVDPVYPEIIFAYNNIDQGMIDAMDAGFGPSTIGVENAAGSSATAFANLEPLSGALADGDQICFDWEGPDLTAVTLTYQATVDSGVEGTLTNVVAHDTGNAGSKPASASASVEVVKTAVDIKNEARDLLSGAMPTGDKKTDKAFERAIKAIDKSLTPSWWDGPSHVTTDKVFNAEKKAVRDLKKVKGAFESLADEASAFLTTADSRLAQTAIDDAIARDGNLGRIKKAQSEMVKAAEDLSDGRYDKAIDHYKKAWKQATKA